MDNQQFQPPYSAPAYQQYNQEAGPTQPPQSAQTQPLAPEVVHHRSNNEDSDAEDEPDQKSPGDVPKRYLNLEFEATFHEHEKTALFKPVHDVLGIVYKWIKLIVYHFFVFIVGIPILILWAFLNGIMAFIYSWLWSPVLRLTIFWIAAVLPLVTMPLVSIFRPLVDVAARCLRQIRCKNRLTGQGFVQNV